MLNIKLTDLIDTDVLQEIQDGFADITGMAALTTDSDGTPVTKGSNFTDFCMKYTRTSNIGCRRCEKCDRDGGDRTRSTGRSAAYSCHAGLMDFAAPIMVDGEFIGSFIGGQVLTEKPDESKFRRIAADIGVNPDEYIAALRKVKIVPREKVEASARFLYIIAKNISDMAYTNYKMNRQNAVGTMAERFVSLSALADECVGEVQKAGATIKVIQDVALNTRILGFNASIEASRAKEGGKGFGVIAQEVRTLADTSKKSADGIEERMRSISDIARRIDESAQDAKHNVDTAMADLDELKNVISQLKN